MEAWTDNWLKGRVFWSSGQTFDRSVIKTKNIIFILDEKDLGRETPKFLRNKKLFSSRRNHFKDPYHRNIGRFPRNPKDYNEREIPNLIL